MPDAHSRLADKAAPVTQIADATYRSLTSALSRRCADLYDMDVRVTRVDAGPPMKVRVHCEDRFELRLRVTVEHVGGNVYDVFCTIEEGASSQLTYSRPEGADTPLPLCPRLGQRFSAFVMEELERRLGRWHLCREED
ncbi:hypothetical protein [Salinibacter grassmerensis]|uniref:hypothetical protein n=1 Tax=Salinibacter grassmerensis TaxID=3040353 RepID=UPI0021E6DDD1|nr:hypothetical protein [Salinibacter grassmerensis]